MEIAEIIRALVRLRAYYPSSNVADETLALFAADLRAIDDSILLPALDAGKHEWKWFPSLCEIEAACQRQALVGTPSPSLAWSEVVRLASSWSPGQPGSQWSSPLVAQAVASVGWNRIRDRQNGDGYVQRDFERAYSELREGAASARMRLEEPKKRCLAPGGEAR